jgi:hypothetical protein
MTQGKYVELSVAQRTEVWRRWKEGESLHTIGRVFDRPHTSILKIRACRERRMRRLDRRCPISSFFNTPWAWMNKLR